MTRKKITLPVSGYSCTVRKMSVADLAYSAGEIPIIAPEENKVNVPTAKAKADYQKGIDYMRIAITNCCSPLTAPNGIRYRIVQGELDQLGECELHWGELPDEDAHFIFDAVAELSGLKKEVADKAATFPPEQETTGGAGQHRAPVSQTP